jgi:hypothetical protein
VIGAGRLAVPDDPVNGRQGHIGCLRKLAQRPTPPLPERVDAPAARVWVLDSRHRSVVPQNGIPVQPVSQNGTEDRVTIDEMAGQFVHPEYKAMLAALIRQAEGIGETLDIPKTTAWHFTTDSPKAKPTLKAAGAIRSALLAIFPDVSIPPVVAPVRSREHGDWISIGEWLAEHDPAAFAATLERLRDIKKGKEAQFALGTIDHDGVSDL